MLLEMSRKMEIRSKGTEHIKNKVEIRTEKFKVGKRLTGRTKMMEE